jgi:hypothetical protein
VSGFFWLYISNRYKQWSSEKALSTAHFTETMQDVPSQPCPRLAWQNKGSMNAQEELLPARVPSELAIIHR